MLVKPVTSAMSMRNPTNHKRFLHSPFLQCAALTAAIFIISPASRSLFRYHCKSLPSFWLARSKTFSPMKPITLCLLM